MNDEMLWIHQVPLMPFVFIFCTNCFNTNSNFKMFQASVFNEFNDVVNVVKFNCSTRDGMFICLLLILKFFLVTFKLTISHLRKTKCILVDGGSQER